MVYVEEVTTETAPFYRALTDKLMEEVASDNPKEKIQTCLGQATTDIPDKTNQPFSASKLTDELAKTLLLVGNDSNSDTDTASQALQVVQILAQINSDTYLPCVAASVAKVVKEQQETTEGIASSKMHVSDALLNLWMQQLTHSDSVSVHSNLLDALVILSTASDLHILSRAMGMLVQIWKPLQESSSAKDASIIAVRCATLWIQWLQKLGGKAVLQDTDPNQEAQGLFIQMIQNFDDRLQQLTLMDLLNEYFGNSDSNDNGDAMDVDQTHDAVLQEFLASPALLSPILQMLQDPMLSGTALQYLSGVLVKLRRSDVQTVLDHIRRVGTVSNDTERLQIVHAMTNVATVAIQDILSDPTLRHAWWDMARLSNSKLQAAILTSVALTLPKLDKDWAMKMYNFLGPDNSNTTSNDKCTTQGLLERFVASPMNELRIAAYAVLAAMLRLDTTGSIMALSTPTSVQAQLLEILMDPQRHESTSDARLAYFDVIESMYELLNGNNNESSAGNVWVATMNEEHLTKVKQQLHKRIQMGPHGREPQRWDVATE